MKSLRIALASAASLALLVGPSLTPVVAIAQTAAAQASEEPSVGTRIRIGLPDTLRAYPFARHGQWVVGTVVRATQDSLVLLLHREGPSLFISSRYRLSPT